MKMTGRVPLKKYLIVMFAAILAAAFLPVTVHAGKASAAFGSVLPDSDRESAGPEGIADRLREQSIAAAVGNSGVSVGQSRSEEGHPDSVTRGSDVWGTLIILGIVLTGMIGVLVTVICMCSEKRSDERRSNSREEDEADEAKDSRVRNRRRGRRGDSDEATGYGEAVGYDENAGDGNTDYDGTVGHDGSAGYGRAVSYDEEAAYAGAAGYDENAGYAGAAGYDESADYAGAAGYDENAAYAGAAGYDENAAYAGAAGYDESADYAGAAGYDENAGYAGAADHDEEAEYAGDAEYIGTVSQEEAAGYAGNGDYDENAEYIGNEGYDWYTGHDEEPEYDEAIATDGNHRPENGNLQPAEPPIIKVDNVTMRFRVASSSTSGLKDYIIQKLKKQITTRELLALDGVSFDIFKGEVVGIIGTNGSGKSTLLKIVSGAMAPTRGRVLVDKSKIQILTLGTGFDMELSARENVYLNGAIIGYPREFLNTHYDEIVAFAELEGFMDTKVKNFSSGMVSRLGFAIATVGDAAEILILDEILSVGDEFFRKKSLKRIKEMIHGGSTVIMVSHSMGTIRENCTKVVWIEKGVLQMVGDAGTVCGAYQKMKSN